MDEMACYTLSQPPFLTLPSFPRKRESVNALYCHIIGKHLWIPAYAGMTVERAGITAAGVANPPPPNPLPADDARR